MGKFEKKNILITGTSAGIGKALAHHFAAEGAEVFAVSRRAASWQEGNIHSLSADIREVEKILSWARGEGAEAIDILINNAGIICYERLMDVPMNEVERVFGTNVFATLALSREVARAMAASKKGGVIVNTLSFAASIPSVGSGIYAASKAAMASLTRTMAAEWAPYGIRVNGYSPGVIETDMTLPALEKARGSMTDALALHRIGSTEDVVRAVAFLASEDSSYMAGVNLDVSGGKFIVQNAAAAWAVTG